MQNKTLWEDGIKMVRGETGCDNLSREILYSQPSFERRSDKRTVSEGITEPAVLEGN
jgi:hypothetical protein